MVATSRKIDEYILCHMEGSLAHTNSSLSWVIQVQHLRMKGTSLRPSHTVHVQEDTRPRVRELYTQNTKAQK